MPVRVDRVGHASQLCARLSALLSSSSLIDLEISCEQRIVAAHKLVMAAASKFFAERLCRTDLNVAVAVHLEDFGVHISHCALAFVVQFVYQGSIVIPDDVVEAVGKAAEALGVDGLEHLLQREQLPRPEESRSKRGLNREQEQPARREEQQGDKEEDSSLLCIEIDGDLNVVRSKKRKTRRGSEQSETIANEQLRRRSEESRLQHQNRVEGQEDQEEQTVFPQDEVNQQQREGEHRPVLNLRQQEEVPPSAESNVSHMGQERQHDCNLQQEFREQLCEQRSKRAEEPQIQERASQEEEQLDSNKGGQQLETLQHQSELLESEEHRDQMLQVRKEQQMTAYKELQYLPNQQLVQQENIAAEQECRDNCKEQQWQPQPVLVPMTDNSGNTSSQEGLNLQILQELREQFAHDWVNHTETINNGPLTITSKQGPANPSVEAMTEMNRQTPIQVMALARQTADATNPAVPIMLQNETTIVQEGSADAAGESTTAAISDSSSSYLDLSINAASSTLFPCPTPPQAFNTTQPMVDEDRMLAIRSGVPIALQSRRRRRKDNDASANKKRSNDDCDRRGDLGIRKDLTLPTAPNGEDNVFQPENVLIEDLPQFPVIHIDDNDSELENTADDMGLVEDNTDDNNESALNFSAVDEIINDNDNEDNATIESGTGSAGFTCLECTMTFAKPDQLRMHVRHAHQKEETVFCPVCKQGGIKGKQDLKLHLYYAHAIGEIFRCEECGFETANKSAFNRHKQKHGSSLASTRASFRCEQCDKEFTTKRRYDNHCRTHTQPSVFKCQYCEFSCSKRRSLVAHLVVKHHKDVEGNSIEASITCTICNYKCYTANQLRVHHRRKHTSWESMRYKCDLCDYATIEKGALVKHIRFKHTKEKPFKCSQCDYSACTQSSLLRHQRSHQQLKPYECHSCGQKFADKKRRDEHQRSHDNNGTNKKFVQCPVCPFTTARKDNLTSHMRRKHPSVFESNGTGRSNDDTSNIDESEQCQNVNGDIDRSHIVGLVKADGSIRPVARTTLTTPTRESSLEADEEDNGRVRVEFIDSSLSEPTTTPTTLLPSSIPFSSSLSQLSVSTATVLNPDDPEANAEEIIVFQSNSDTIAPDLPFTN